MEILRLIGAGELPSGEIASRFEISPPAVSQHLKVLVDAGLAVVRREGTYRYYRARPEALAELREFLDLRWEDAPRQATEVRVARSMLHVLGGTTWRSIAG